jgi:RsmE family RNA methyltransferase
MNSICFYQNEISDEDFIEFSDSKRMDHLKIHLKSKVDDILKITILGKGIFDAKLTKFSNHSAKLKIIETKQSKSGWFNLAIGLSRPQTMKKLLEHATTFGANSFHILKAQLSEKSYATSKLYENNKYEEFLIDGLSQSKTYFKLPKVNISNYLNLSSLDSFENKFFLTFNSDHTFLDYKSQLSNPLIAIGPERGWTKKEEEKLLEAGFIGIGISDTCLRVEHASFAAIAQIEMLRINSNVD